MMTSHLRSYLARILAVFLLVIVFVQFMMIQNTCDHVIHRKGDLVYQSGCSGRSEIADDVIRQSEAGDEMVAQFLQSSGEEQVDCLRCLDYSVNQEQARLAGTPRTHQGVLTVGIPTIRRQDGYYLITTIQSLLNHTTVLQLHDLTIVIFLADFHPDVKKEILGNIVKEFPSYIESGVIHVIEAPQTFYPDMEVVKRTYGDPEKQVKWRSKQNYDYAFLMKYCINISQYYMQLEDDVVTSVSYYDVIWEFIHQQQEPWTCLEFSELGYIGKLYHSSDIDKLAKTLMLFWEDQPPDFTYIYFNILSAQFQTKLRIPTIFQHMGYHSSLPDKIQPLKDRYFDNSTKIYKGHNPPADFFTSFTIYEPFKPSLAYSLSDGYFWVKVPEKSQALLMVFDKPERVRRLVIDTGSREHPDDIIVNATVEVSPTLIYKNPDNAECANYVPLGSFKNGKFEIEDSEKWGNFQLFCVLVTLQADQVSWIIFREIAVFLHD